MVSQHLVIWGKIFLWITVFFGPYWLMVIILRRGWTKCDCRGDVTSISPNPAILLMSWPAVVLTVLWVWAFPVSGGDIHPIHVISLVGLVFLMFWATTEVGPRWSIHWTDELLEGPRQFVYFRRIKRASMLWDEVVAIREDRGKIMLEAGDGRTITFSRKYRGFLKFLQAVYLKRPNIRDKSAPNEWFSDSVRMLD